MKTLIVIVILLIAPTIAFSQFQGEKPSMKELEKPTVNLLLKSITLLTPQLWLT